jgi:hypothetical protein
VSRTNLKFDRLVACDELVAKALKVTEISQIARAETRMREYLLAHWEEMAQEAAKSASRKTSVQGMVAEVTRVMGKWAEEVRRRYLEEFSKIYFQARIAGWKKVNGLIKEDLSYDIPEGKKVEKAVPKGSKLVRILPFFEVVDDSAVKALASHQLFWLGTHYEDHVSRGVAQTAKEMIERGAHPREVREKLLETLGTVSVPGGYTGSARTYFEGVVANAATVARVQGQMRSFADYGVTTYEIVNPRDSRTCPECSHMDGKTFSVRQGSEVMDDVLGAKNPDQVKKAQPWLRLGELKKISPTPGKAGPKDAAALAGAKFCLPPFHFKCRCTVDVSEEAGSWRLAGATEDPPAPPPPPKELPPVPVARPSGVPPPPAKLVPPSAKKPRAATVPRPVAAPATPVLPPTQAPTGTPVTRPPSFPFCKQVPTTPNDYYNEDRLCGALKKTRTPKGSRSISQSAPVRQEFHALCAGHGFHPKDIQDTPHYWAKMLDYRTQKAGGGLHNSSTGQIYIENRLWTQLRSWAKLTPEKRAKAMTDLHGEDRWAYHVTLHETIHGHGPSRIGITVSGDTQRRIASFVEEMTTEASTVQVSIKMFGGEIDDFIKITDLSDRYQSIYAQPIHGFSQHIHRTMNKLLPSEVWHDINRKMGTLPGTLKDSYAAAHRMVVDASMRFKQLSGNPGTFDGWLNKFVECLEAPPEAVAGMTKEEIRVLTEKLREEAKKALLSPEMWIHIEACIK